MTDVGSRSSDARPSTSSRTSAVDASPAVAVFRTHPTNVAAHTTVHHDYPPPQLFTSSARSRGNGDSPAIGFTSPHDADALLRESLEAQRVAQDSFLVRHDAFDEEQRVKRRRLDLLKRQQQRREAWMAMDAEAVQEMAEMLEVLSLAVRDRLTSLRPDGYRAFVFQNGDRYEGSWKNCKMHGKGVLRRENLKDVYEGQWFGGQRTGLGSYHCSAFSFFYNGAWLDNRHHGKGELVEPEGTFSGEFANNLICGYGEYCYEDGHVYKGEWMDGVYQGTGTYLYPSGARYEGQWEGGLEHGRGTMLYANGDVYAGDWCGGYPHGSGTYERRSGGRAVLRIEGQWLFGSVHGPATCTYEDGTTYTGEWACDRFEGQGTLHVPGVPSHPSQGPYNNPVTTAPAALPPSTAGTKGADDAPCAITYRGGFHRGLRDGLGAYESADTVYTGHWRRGEKSGGSGSITTRGCGTLSIDWAHDVPCGEGVYVTCTGKAQPVLGTVPPSNAVSRANDEEAARHTQRRVDVRLEAERLETWPAEPLD